MQARQGDTINCDNSENVEKQCLLEPDKFFSNMVFTLNYRVAIENQSYLYFTPKNLSFHNLVFALLRLGP